MEEEKVVGTGVGEEVGGTYGGGGGW